MRQYRQLSVGIQGSGRLNLMIRRYLCLLALAGAGSAAVRSVEISERTPVPGETP
jgi:hypothetical protein